MLQNPWFYLALGDGLLAEPVLAELAGLSLRVAERGLPPTVFLRRRQQGLHCEVVVYFSPNLQRWAQTRNAAPCPRPQRAGLELLVGGEGGWQWFV